MSYRHIQIGCGKFGLGFAGYLANLGSWSTLIIGRETRDHAATERNLALLKERRYDIQYFGESNERVEIGNFDFSLTDFDSPSESGLAAFGARDLEFITVAVPAAAYPSVARLLANAFGHRFRTLGASHPVTVLACVNHYSNGPRLFEAVKSEAALRGADAGFQEYLGRLKDYFPPCVVDRICDNLTTHEGKVVVEAERYARLILPKWAEKLVHRLSVCSPNEIVFTEDIEAWEKAKYWGVAGAQLLLASEMFHNASQTAKLDGSWRTTPFVDFLNEQPDKIQLIKAFLAEIAVAIAVDHPAPRIFSELRTYFDDARGRLQRAKDSPNRILKEFRLSAKDWKRSLEGFPWPPHDARAEEREAALMAFLVTFHRHTMGDFLAKIHNRLVTPMTALAGHGLQPIGLMQTLTSILAMMAKEADNVA